MRVAGGLLLLLAVALYAGVAAPLQRQAAAAGGEYRQARQARQRARSRLADLQRRDAARARAEAVLAAARAAPGGGLREVRRHVVDLVNRAHVSGIRLGVRPGHAPVSATVGLSAEGSFADVVGLTSELAQPASGLVLERVRLSSRATRVALDLSAAGLGRRP